MWARLRRSLCLLLPLAAWHAALSESRAAEPAASVVSLLDSGWKPSLAAYEATRKQYVQLRAGSPRDLRTSYAMTLVAIQHRKLREAAEFLDDALAAKPNNLRLRKARLWLLFANKDYKTALAEMPAFAKDVAAIEDSADSAEIVREYAQALGELIGFAQGPVSEALRATDVNGTERKIVELLPPAALEVFREARSSITEKQQQMEAELDEVRTKSKLDQDARRELDLAQLAQQREIFEAHAKLLPSQYAKREAKLQASLRSAIANNKLEVEYDKKTGLIKSQKYSNQQEITSLQNEIATLPSLQAADLAQLAESSDRAARRISQLERLAEPAARLTKTENGQSMVIRKRLESFASYREFPLEEERDRLIASFDKKNNCPGGNSSEKTLCGQGEPNFRCLQWSPTQSLVGRHSPLSSK